MPTKKLTHVEILKAYKAANQFETDMEFADALGISRQKLDQWLDGQMPHADWLKLTALTKKGTWVGDMAEDLLELRGIHEVLLPGEAI